MSLTRTNRKTTNAPGIWMNRNRGGAHGRPDWKVGHQHSSGQCKQKFAAPHPNFPSWNSRSLLTGASNLRSFQIFGSAATFAFLVIDNLGDFIKMGQIGSSETKGSIHQAAGVTFEDARINLELLIRCKYNDSFRVEWKEYWDLKENQKLKQLFVTARDGNLYAVEGELNSNNQIHCLAVRLP